MLYMQDSIPPYVRRPLVWRHILEGGRVVESLRLCLDDSSPSVIAAASEATFCLMGGRLLQEILDIQESLTAGTSLSETLLWTFKMP